MASFDSLPDEVALMIVRMAATDHDYPLRPIKKETYNLFILSNLECNHDFLVDVLCKVSRRFQKLATDYSLWKGHVLVTISDKEEHDARKDEFVVNVCLNSGTTKFCLQILQDREACRLASPSWRFPNLQLRKVYTSVDGERELKVYRRDGEEESDDEVELWPNEQGGDVETDRYVPQSPPTDSSELSDGQLDG